jgi:hypothetical protein
MKGLALAVALFLVSVAAQAQGLQKGNLVGTHVTTIELAPGVTMDEYAKAWAAKMIPALEKNMPGWKFYPVKRVRGEKADGLAIIIVVRSEAERDKYFNADGTATELGKAVTAKLAPIRGEMDKLGKETKDVYTDWLVY